VLGRASSALIVLLASSAAFAQASTGIVADRLRPALGPTTLAGVEGADVTAKGVVSTMFGLGYLQDPIVLRSAVDGSVISHPVRDQLVGNFGFEVGLPRGFAVHASLPVVITNDGDRLQGTGVAGSGNNPGPSLTSAAGDLRFGVKVALLGATTRPGLHVAISLDGTVPLGGQADFAATSGPSIAPRVMIDYRLPWLTLVLDAEARFEPTRHLFDTTLGDELVLSGGAIARIVTLDRAQRWRLFGYVETEGTVSSDASARPVELRAALRVGREGGVDIDLGGGAGLVDAVGAPRFRVFALLRTPLAAAR
jgi:hypothetical protein